MKEVHTGLRQNHEEGLGLAKPYRYKPACPHCHRQAEMLPAADSW